MTVQDLPRGLEGVVVSTTSIGDVRGEEGFYHYRQYSAAELAVTRDLVDVVALLVDGALPTTVAEHDAIAAELHAARLAPPELLDAASRRSRPPAARRWTGSAARCRSPARCTACSRSTTSTPRPRRGRRAAHRRRRARRSSPRSTGVAGLAPVAPRPDLGVAADYLWMLHGTEPAADAARAVERYLVLTVDHGFNASTFTARIATSTGADLGRHRHRRARHAVGSAPRRRAEPRARDARRDRRPGRRTPTYDRATWSRDGERDHGLRPRRVPHRRPAVAWCCATTAHEIDGPLVEFAEQVEEEIVAALAELKPGRELYTNVEYYAGVVMDAAGVPPRAVHPDVHGEPQHRLDRPCARAGRRQPPGAAREPLRG